MAQLSLGLAGFAGVVVMLGHGPGKWNPADALRIRCLLTAVFATFFVSLIPLGIEASGIPLSHGIRVGAALLVVFIAYYLSLALQAGDVDPSGEVLQFRFKVLFRAVAILAALAQLPIVLGIGDERAFILFFAGLSSGLFCGALVFQRLIHIRPRES